MLQVQIKGLRNLQKSLKAQSKKQKRALEIAIKIEGFRRLRQLREEIRKGTPGGRPYIDKLSIIARRTKTGRLRKNQAPLYRLARLLRYNVEYDGGDIRMSFGFVRSGKSPMTSSWKQLILEHEEGADFTYRGSRTELGRRFARIGGKLKKRGDQDARFFFLRRTTGRRIDLPERPMIEPFWKNRNEDMKRSIASNFKRKMKGERI